MAVRQSAGLECLSFPISQTVKIVAAAFVSHWNFLGAFEWCLLQLHASEEVLSSPLLLFLFTATAAGRNPTVH